MKMHPTAFRLFNLNLLNGKQIKYLLLSIWIFFSLSTTTTKIKSHRAFCLCMCVNMNGTCYRMATRIHKNTPD